MKVPKFTVVQRSPIAFQRISIGVLLSVFCAILFFVHTPTAFANTRIDTAPIMAASLFHFSGSQPKNLGIKNGKLLSCPSSPNCVCSQDLDAEHQIEPLTYTGDSQEAFDRLKSIVQSLDRATIIEDKPNYFYAEFTSKLMGFVDDVEFYLDETVQKIQVRSASRLGESDLGVNRQRIETIRSKFIA
jgi:uncharacterized protein (DUF1499 family)